MRIPEVVGEFREAFRRPHTFNLRSNLYLLFGIAWGLTFPVIFLLANRLGSSSSEPTQMLGTAVGIASGAFPFLFGLVFGALGTIRHEKARQVRRTLEILDAEVAERTQNIADTHTQTVFALAQAIEAKDPYTHGHCYRVWKFAERAALNLGIRRNDLEELMFACYLHDIGKIRVPGRILNKPGRLTDEEFRVVQQHPVYSQRIVLPIRNLNRVAMLIRHHHERWDGSGYPDGLSDSAIPILARVMVVADALDAMTSTRPYRKALPMQQAVEEVRRCAGLGFDADLVPGRHTEAMRHFDPRISEAMLDGLDSNPIDDSLPEEPTMQHLHAASESVRKRRPVGQMSADPLLVEPLNCWEVLGCGQAPPTNGNGNGGMGCIVPKAADADGLNQGVNAGRICWAVATQTSLCCAQGSTDGALGDCRSCEFFAQVKEEEGLAHLQLVPPRRTSSKETRAD